MLQDGGIIIELGNRRTTMIIKEHLSCFILIILAVSLTPLVFILDMGLPSILGMVLFALLLIASKLIRASMWRYAGTAAALVCCVYFISLLDVPFHKLTFVFIIPLMFAFVIPVPGFITAIGMVLAFQLSTYYGKAPQYEINNQVTALIMQSLFIDIIAYLVRRLHKERDDYKKLALTDSLTGLFHFDYLIKTGQRWLEHHDSISVTLIDLDYFKQINDTYGHIAGNQVLIKVAELLRIEASAHQGLAARLGGDEFIIMLKNTCPAARTFKERILRAVEAAPLTLPGGNEIHVRLSIGTANSAQARNSDIQELIHLADMDMYKEKQNKK